MDGASVAIVCRIFAHKGDTANRPMPFWQLDHGIPACRPWVNLNTLKIFIGVAGNPSGFHCCQPFGMVLGQLNGNTQIQITVRGLSPIGQSVQSIHLFFREIHQDLKAAVGLAVRTQKSYYSVCGPTRFYLGFCRLF